MPFDTENLFGFYIELFIQSFATYFYMWIYSGIGSIYYGFYRYLHALVQDFAIVVQQIDGLTNRKTNARQRIELLKDSVELHIECKRVVRNLCCIMHGPLFFALLTFVGFLAINIFLLDRVSFFLYFVFHT